MFYVYCQLENERVKKIINRKILQWFYSIDHHEVKISKFPHTFSYGDIVIQFIDEYHSNTLDTNLARCYTVYIFRTETDVLARLQKSEEIYTTINEQASEQTINQSVGLIVEKLLSHYVLVGDLNRRKLAIKQANNYYLVDFNDIFYFEHVMHLRKIRVVCRQRNYLYRTSLSAVTDKLPSSFFRCHHGVIVNLKQIKRINREEQQIYFSQNKKVHTSVRGYYRLMKRIKEEQ